MDRPGKDTYRHREAGAHEVLVATAHRWALLHEVDGAGAGAARPAGPHGAGGPGAGGGVQDRTSFPSSRCTAPRSASRRSGPDWPDVVAVASDATLADCPRPVLALNDPAAVAAWIVAVPANSTRRGSGSLSERPREGTFRLRRPSGCRPRRRTVPGGSLRYAAYRLSRPAVDARRLRRRVQHVARPAVHHGFQPEPAARRQREHAPGDGRDRPLWNR